MKNCDNCNFYNVDAEDFPCSICDDCSHWEIANDLKGELDENSI